MRKAVTSSAITDAMRTPTEYSPTSSVSASLTMKKRSLKFVTQKRARSGGAAARSGSSAEEGAIELEPELLAPVADEGSVHEQRSREVPDDHSERPASSATTSRSVAPMVIPMFARLAVTYATERSSTRKSEVSCS